MTSNCVFFCLNSIQNPFVNPDLINTTYPRNWVILMQYFCQKSKILAICILLIHVSLNCKRTTTDLENCTRSYRYNRGTLLAAARPPAIFTISITEFFLWKTPLKILSKFLKFRSNGATWCLTAVSEYYATQNIFSP